MKRLMDDSDDNFRNDNASDGVKRIKKYSSGDGYGSSYDRLDVRLMISYKVGLFTCSLK